MTTADAAAREAQSGAPDAIAEGAATGPAVPRPPIWLLVALTTLSPVAVNVVAPSLPGLAAAFGTDYGTAQLTLTFYLVGVAIGQLLYGPLSDRFGRRPVLLGGIAVYLGASALCLLAPSIDALIAGRFAQAVGGCSGMVLSRAIIRDVWDREKSASVLGYVTMGMAVGPMMAPAIGGLLDAWAGWRGAYWMMLLVGLVVAGVAFSSLRETNAPRPDAGGFGGLLAGSARLMRSPAFLGYALAGAFNTAAFFSFLAAAPYLTVEVLGMAPHQYGLWFMMVSLGYMTGNFLSGRFSMTVGLERMVLIGGCGYVVAAVVMDVLLSGGGFTAREMFVPMMVAGVGSGMVLPNVIAAGVSVDPRAAGAASGLMGFLQMALSAVATAAVGAMQDGTPRAMATAITVCSVLAVLSFVVADRSRRAASA
jgi:DHA1 family bicyclomycin/chloramphenicol resistance-like MFS transporter